MIRPFLILGMIGGAALISTDLRAAEEQRRRPALPFTISKETTYLTEPLRPDGSVDYAEAINQRHSKGVAPENNAATLIWRAAGPKEIPQELRLRYFARIGIEPPAEEDEYLIELHAFPERRRPPLSEDERKELDEQYEIASSRPWSRNECPLVAQWLSVNEKPLALVVEASKRPRRFDPLLVGGDDDGLLFASLLPNVSVYRNAARLLCARALLKANENDLAGAWDDLLACYRLSRLMGQGSTLIESLVAVAIDSIAFNVSAVLLERRDIGGEQLARIRRDLAALTPQRRMAVIVDQGERFMFLDCVAMLARQGLSKIDDFAYLAAGERRPALKTLLTDILGKTAIDWDYLMRRGNGWYDRISAALNKPSLAQRKVALTQLRDELNELKKSAVDPMKFFADGLVRPRQAVSERLADVLIALLVPAVDACVLVEDRWIVQHEVLLTGLAAAAYAEEHGRLPESLDRLVPNDLPKVPEDLLCDPPGTNLRYKTTDEGCLIYSVGRNGRDDEGRTMADAEKAARSDPKQVGEQPDWDDITIRLKAPADKVQ